jgi:hypothetical protein
MEEKWRKKNLKTIKKKMKKNLEKTKNLKSLLSKF